MAPEFEPTLRPEIAIAAVCAAIPPIVYWLQVFVAEEKRRRAVKLEHELTLKAERARLELKRKITGENR